ncbi:MAG TPA: HupE/UreJ family protein [Verrucomicrobiota bacterium]|nr:urease accessory protein UreJ [Verrucomicrobiales bacterium]HRI12490.1 HupE/UreJ family protein [Verrucomicrobiota bacterium]
MKTRFKSSVLIALLVLAPSVANAHPGHPASGLAEGLAHPLTGLDHLLAMVAVGLWAAQIGGRARWIVPSAFVGTMVLGGAMGMSGVPVPWVEQGIVASVFVLGLLIALATKPKLSVTVPVVAAFALFHGHAHGTEMVSAATGLLYATGFALATAMLHLTGVGLGQVLAHQSRGDWLRLAGGGIALAGVVLAFN